MKSNFNFSLPEFKINESAVFPGLAISANLEYSAEEFMAVLPHVVELRKVMGQISTDLRRDMLAFLSAAGAAITPELLRTIQQATEAYLLSTGTESDQALRHKQERHDLEMQNLREMHALELKLQERESDPGPTPDAVYNGNGRTPFGRRG